MSKIKRPARKACCRAVARPAAVNVAMSVPVEAYESCQLPALNSKWSTSSVSTPEVVGSTSLPKKSLSYRWVFNDAQVFLDNSEMFTGPIFEVSLPLKEKRVSKWQLMIKKHSESFAVYLCFCSLSTSSARSTSTHKVLVSDCVFSILNFDMDEVTCACSAKLPSKLCVLGGKAEVCGIDNFIDQHGLATSLDGRTLTLQVDATLLCLTDHSECVETNNTLIPADDIRKDIAGLHYDYLFSDVTITCGGKEFRAHKVILASQSPVFKKMFEIDMREKRSGIIEVSDIARVVMSDLLAYLYTGTAPHVDTLARELLNVADKYELPRLLTICETTLMSKITAKSVLEMLILAELHEAKSLKKACLGFIKCNFARICELDSWNNMKTTNSDIHQMLVCEILEFCELSL